MLTFFWKLYLLTGGKDKRIHSRTEKRPREPDLKGSGGALTLVDVVPDDFDVVVAVVAGVLVVEAQRVQQLVLDDAVTHAAEPLQGEHLLASGGTQRGITA